MNPTQTPHKPYNNAFEKEGMSAPKTESSELRKQAEIDTHSAWESYLTNPVVESPKIEIAPTVETARIVEAVDLVEIKTSESEATRTEISILDLEREFYGSSPSEKEIAVETKTTITEKTSIDIFAPLETVGKSAFAAYDILNKGYKGLPVKDVQAAFKNFSKNFWEMFITGDYFKKKDDKKKDEKKPTVASPMVFSMSNSQTTRLEQTSTQINQQIGSGNLSFRGSVNQTTGEVFAYYQAEAERAQTFAQKAAQKRNSALQVPTGKDKPGIPGMGKNSKKGAQLEMSLERQHSSKGGTLTSALG